MNSNILMRQLGFFSWPSEFKNQANQDSKRNTGSNNKYVYYTKQKLNFLSMIWLYVFDENLSKKNYTM